ncbi:MAG: hypothetical protein HC859_05025 [Bacteroidia bacterium]|nr:hypothetical protein [Bacteroidia bacterium]
MRRFITTSLLLFMAVYAGAQFKTNKDYWVVESNLSRPDSAVVHFYDGHDQLISSITVKGFAIDITSTKHKKFLNRLLKDIVVKRQSDDAKSIRSKDITSSI